MKWGTRLISKSIKGGGFLLYAGKLRDGSVAMIFWVSRETVMTWPMRRRM